MGGEGTLKEYPEAYKKIFPMTRGGLLAAGQQCDDESKCDIACPDGSNDCWQQGSCPDTSTGSRTRRPSSGSWASSASLASTTKTAGLRRPRPRTAPLSPRQGKFSRQWRD